MKTRLILLLSFLYCCYNSYAQNLVPNPSFEDTIECPQPLALVSKARYWYSVEETPDYFHECVGNGYFSVPQNSWGYQWPSTGAAYVGMVTYANIPTGADTTYHEAIGAHLTEPVIVGQRYYVTFKACLAFSPNKGANIATDKLGVLFSTSDFLSSPPPRNNFAHVYSERIISDTTIWTSVRGTFVADSSYEFISIGSFFNNHSTDTALFYNNSWYASYYFLDDVCVSVDSTYCEMWTSVSQAIVTGNNIEIYPNPVWNDCTISNLPYDCKELQLYDTDGKLLKTVTSIKDFKMSIDFSAFPPGIYLLMIRREKSIQTKKIIKSNL